MNLDFIKLWETQFGFRKSLGKEALLARLKGFTWQYPRRGKVKQVLYLNSK